MKTMLRRRILHGTNAIHKTQLIVRFKNNKYYVRGISRIDQYSKCILMTYTVIPGNGHTAERVREHDTNRHGQYTKLSLENATACYNPTTFHAREEGDNSRHT